MKIINPSNNIKYKLGNSKFIKYSSRKINAVILIRKNYVYNFGADFICLLNTCVISTDEANYLLLECC